jgi:hypothetical protein
MLINNPIKITIGFILVLLGLAQILDNAYIIDFSIGDFWPIFPSIAAIILWVNYFSTKDINYVLPASIVTTISCIFFIATLSRYIGFSELWPAFILAPGIGFWMLSVLDKDSNKNYIRPALILTVISSYFFLNNIYYLEGEYLFGTILIIIGISILVKKDKEHADNIC